MIISLAVEIILFVLIATTFKALQLDTDYIIDSIKNSSEKHILNRSALTLGALLIILWQIYRISGRTVSPWLSQLVFMVIIYEALGSAAIIYFRDAYTNILDKLNAGGFSFMIKFPVFLELLFFCFLFVKLIISEWRFLFS